MNRTDKGLAVFIAVALVAALALAVSRARVERANRAVELIVDADDARLLAVAAGVPMNQVLADLRRAGAGALAVREQTVEELVALGRLMPVSSDQGLGLVSADAENLVALAAMLKARLPAAELGLSALDTPTLVVRGLTLDQIARLPGVLRLEDLRASREAGLRLVARLMNSPAASPRALDAAAAQAQAAGARLVIFREDQVLGYPDLVSEAAEALKRQDLQFGLIEMAGQKGDEALARETVDRLVRVHSITDADMLVISPAAAVQRYERAVVERNVRACYLRLFLRAQRDALTANVRYVRRVADSLKARGFRLGPAQPLRPPRGYPSKPARALALLGVPAGMLLLLRRLAPLRAVPTWLLFAGLCAAGSLAMVDSPGTGAPVFGLAAACAFPALGVVWSLQRCRVPEFHLSLGQVLGRGLIELCYACLISLAGAALIVAAFSPANYLVGVGRFAAVKLAYTAPLAVVLVAAVMGLPGGSESAWMWWARVRTRTVQVLGRPITVAQVLVAAIALAALAFGVSRSGNQPAVAPSGMELKLRAALEDLLLVRPRTKEFLLGHPALMLAVALSLRGRRGWIPLIGVLAAVGQVSLVNTFCHFHTPLLVGIVRTANGLWLGAVVGVVVVVMWRLLCDRPPRARKL